MLGLVTQEDKFLCKSDRNASGLVLPRNVSTDPVEIGFEYFLTSGYLGRDPCCRAFWVAIALFFLYFDILLFSRVAVALLWKYRRSTFRHICWKGRVCVDIRKMTRQLESKKMSSLTVNN